MTNDNGNKKSLPRATGVTIVILLMATIMGLLINSFYVPITTVWLFSEIKHNQVKWQSFKFSNYQITTKIDDFSEISGTYTLDVKNSEVVQVTVLQARWLEPDDSLSPQDFYQLSIDGLFQNAYDCIAYSPPRSCSFQFDSQYGYPTNIHSACNDLDLGCLTDTGQDITVSDVKLLPK